MCPDDPHDVLLLADAEVREADLLADMDLVGAEDGNPVYRVEVADGRCRNCTVDLDRQGTTFPGEVLPCNPPIPAPCSPSPP